MEHHFDVEIATTYGMLEAVILNNLWFWIKHNEANDKNYHDGYYWTFNSVKAFKELFPYASDKKIRNALKHLEDENIIITGNYNTSAYDRTTWYAITEKGKCILLKGQMEVAKKENGSSEKGEPIPYNKPNNKIDSKHKEKSQLIIDFVGDDKELEKAFLDFIDMRKQIKKPLTDRAFKMIVKKLDGMAKTDEEKIEILDQSILHNWQDVYPIKAEQKKQPNGVRDNVAHRDYDFADMENKLFNL